MSDLRKREWIAIRSALMTYKPFRFVDEDIREKIIELIEFSAYKKHTSFNGEFNSDLYSASLYDIKINIITNQSDNKLSIIDNKLSIIDDDFLVKKLYNYANLVKLARFLPENLIKFLSRKAINPSKIININPQYFNKKNESYFKDIQIRANTSIKVKTTKLYLCNRCKQRNTKIRKQQTRGLDEGETIFIECVSCGNSWKQY